MNFNDKFKLLKKLGYADAMLFTYHRKPTQSEIKFGHGATHYKDFRYMDCKKKDGEIKQRLKCPIDGLIYTR